MFHFPPFHWFISAQLYICSGHVAHGNGQKELWENTRTQMLLCSFCHCSVLTSTFLQISQHCLCSWLRVDYEGHQYLLKYINMNHVLFSKQNFQCQTHNNNWSLSVAERSIFSEHTLIIPLLDYLAAPFMAASWSTLLYSWVSSA